MTVTLKDAQGNSVSGQASALTADTVTVPNASVKAGSSWTESVEGTGVYTAVYTAKTVSTDNKAALKLSGWTAGKTSDAYAITAGTAAQGTSVIGVDNTTYVSGTDMTVTVTLKDAQGNSVSGQASALTADTVTVPNASIKAGSSWTDNGDGTYTGLYTAKTVSTDNKAALKLSDWTAGKTSEAYTITAGGAAQGSSSVTVDNTTYVSGTDMTVTVTLKDAQGNSVSGQASALTAHTVTVPNASVKAGSHWTDNGDGTYTGRYTAKTVSTDNKAALKLSGWTAGKTSDAYAITAGTAAQGTSVIGVDNATYTAGSDITVTVTLKDAQGNSVSGQASALTADTVTVPNASVKAGSSWTDNGDGTYTGLYTAKTVSTDNKAALKLSGWTAGKSSDAYAITAGTAAQGTSSVTVDNTTYVSGTDMTVMVTLKDAQGNSVSGQASALTADTVTVPNASVKAGSSWTDNGDGTYTGLYTAKTVSTDNKVDLKLSGWTAGKTSEAYAITAGAAAQGTSSIITDNATYTAGSDITVTVTLEDAQSNSVSGQASALTANAVTVPNASVKAGSSWTDNGDGTYTGLYVAKIAGTGLKAVLKLSDWSTGVISDEYAVEPDISTAVITLSWLNNEQLTLADGSDQNEMEAVVKDANGNIIPGAKFNIDLPQGVLLFGKSNPLVVNNVGVLKFEIISTNFGSPEIKAIVESSENTASTAVNFSPVNLTLKVKVTD